MNLLGKIFVVFIVLVSFGLMLLSMIVYATHKNWHEEATAVKGRLDQARSENEQLQSRYQSLDSQLKSELEAARQEVRKLETERVTLLNENTTFQKDLDQLNQERREATEMVAETQTNNSGLMKEVAGLRQEIRDTQQARDEAFAITLNSTSELHKQQGNLVSTLERQRQLVKQVSHQTEILRRKGIDPNDSLDAIAPHVRGIVNATRRVSGNQFIEISIGADDGLKPGHTLEVFRGERYLGRAEIMRTEPDRAVARIIRRFQKGQIQEGDNVATKLRVG
jgi:hypothetical protein